MSWVFGAQTYPALQSNGCKAWGERRYPGFIVFNPEPQCFRTSSPSVATALHSDLERQRYPDSLHC